MIPRPTQYEFAQADSLLSVCTAREAASLPYSFVVALCEFAQPGSSFLACNARAAGSRPYGGRAIVSAWHAVALPGGGPGVPDYTPTRCAIVRGHCPQITIFLLAGQGGRRFF